MAATFHSGMGSDYVGAIVAEFGSYATKIGWAGEDIPRAYFRSVCEPDFVL
jgi:actin-related protein